MKTAVMLIISASIALISSDHLANTVWTYQVSKTCIDKLTLKSNRKVIEYDCELNYTFHGSYKVVNDTLLVTVKDDSHSEDHGKVIFSTDKYLVKSNTLCFLGSSKLVNGKWKYTKANAGINLIYHKVK